MKASPTNLARACGLRLRPLFWKRSAAAQLLLMTVRPGFGHLQLLRSTLPKIGRGRDMFEQMQLGCALEVAGIV